MNEFETSWHLYLFLINPNTGPKFQASFALIILPNHCIFNLHIWDGKHRGIIIPNKNHDLYGFGFVPFHDHLLAAELGKETQIRISV